MFNLIELGIIAYSSEEEGITEHPQLGKDRLWRTGRPLYLWSNTLDHFQRNDLPKNQRDLGAGGGPVFPQHYLLSGTGNRVYPPSSELGDID